MAQILTVASHIASDVGKRDLRLARGLYERSVLIYFSKKDRKSV